MNPNLSSATKSKYITTNGVQTISVGKSILVSIIINTKGASSNLIEIYDSNATFGADISRKKGSIDSTVVPGAIPYNLYFETGIYLVIKAGTAPDVTVIYAETP